MPSTAILIADDDTIYLETLAGILAGAGYHDVARTAGRGAFAAILARQPDLVMLDVRTVSCVGWETVHLARLSEATAAIPILICTADPALVREKGAMLRAQRCQILEKPFDIRTLRATITAMVEA